MLMKMPDIAKEEQVALTGSLDRVGMTNIEVPLTFVNSSGQKTTTPAVCDAFVSLDDPEAKGIHMSRLYLSLNEVFESQPLSFDTLKDLLLQFKQSHEGMSESSYIRVSFDLMEKRPALKSDNKGWRSYPVVYKASYKGGVFTYELQARVVYSSTCPCSAALARQLIQQNFLQNFTSDQVDAQTVYNWLGSSEGINATPHSQRSHADVCVKISEPSSGFHPIELIDLVEKSLGTPVQTAVKREDEQEFARLNGQNLMFCEDAGRRIKGVLNSDSRIEDFRVQVNHVESLHPHDAVSVVTKGLSDGYQP